jgi:hypothetical protein
LDFKQIRLGSRWKDEVKSALDKTDITLVYWTRSASSSVWVRNEYEYFLAQYPRRPLVPIVGDETPLAEPLKERQAMTFVPVINELLELKRSMEAEGRKKAEIRASIRKRLEQAGIQLDESDVNRIFRFFGIAGWVAWFPAPLVAFEWVWRSILEAAIQLSRVQVILMFAITAAATAITWQVGSGMRADDLERAGAAYSELESGSRTTEEKLTNELEGARNAYAQFERQVKATKEELTNQLEAARNANTQLQRRSRATEEGLTNQLKVARNDYTRLERQAKAIEGELAKQLKTLDSKFSSHALIEVPGIAKPVLLRFIDSTTERHRFTVQIPSEGHFSFWIPKGSYRIYFAHTDISDKMPQLVSGDVERSLLDETEVEAGTAYKLELKKRDKATTPVSAGEWGRAKPEDKH